MLTRIALGLAIAVGCGAFVLAHMKVAPKIAGLESDNAQLKDERDKSREAETKAKKGEREAKNGNGAADGRPPAKSIALAWTKECVEHVLSLSSGLTTSQV